MSATSSSKVYRINEIFYSLQGEGANSGRPAVFVRFSGCNLRCPFCDTDFAATTPMSANDILQQINQFPSRFVVLTGGEPSLQIDELLLNSLKQAGFTIAIETNGTHTLPSGIDWITVSPKEGSEIVLRKADEVKVVFIGQDVERYRNMITASRYYLQPCSKVVGGSRTDNTAQVVDYCKSHPHWSLSLQTHKLISIP